MSKSVDLAVLQQKIVDFRDARDWKQFHNPKDLAISLLLESGELLEHFQWKNAEEVKKHLADHKNDVSDELADVLYWVLLMSNDLKIDVLDALEKKIKINEDKYPVEKTKGKHTKYNKL